MLRLLTTSLLKNATASWRAVAHAPPALASRGFSAKAPPKEDDDKDDDDDHLPDVAHVSDDEEPFIKATIKDVLKEKQLRNRGLYLWCTKEDSVLDAVKKMTSANVGALLVFNKAPTDGKCGESLDGTGGIAGIVTERDYLRKVIVMDRRSHSTKVSDIMTTKLITVTPQMKVLDAMALMTEKRIRHIPVVDNEHMYGLVSIGDVVRVVVREAKVELAGLKDFINRQY